MKLAFFSILQALIAGFCLYFGVGGFIELHKVVSERKEIANIGLVTEAEIVSKTDQRAGKVTFYLARYKFQVEGYDNTLPWLSEEIKEKHKETLAALKERRPDMASSVFGEDFRFVFGDTVNKGMKVEVMYDPNDPNRNIGGDRRGASYWEMTEGFRLVGIQNGLSFSFGLIALAYLFLSAMAVLNLMKHRSNKSRVATPLARHL